MLLISGKLCNLSLASGVSDPGEAPSQSSEAADSQLEDKDGKKKRQRRQRTHFTSQQLQVGGQTAEA